jgi:hypothetical protein
MLDFAYRDKKLSVSLLRFRAPLHGQIKTEMATTRSQPD